LNLLNSLQELVKKSPGRTALEYSQKLKAQGFADIDRSKVNSTFYRNSTLFEFCKDNQDKPRWFLKDARPIVANTNPLPKIKPIRSNHRKIELYQWQKEALAQWKAQDYQGVVEAVTGAGKTRVGIIAAIEELKQGGFVLVIVPSLELLRQWEKSLKEYLPNSSRIGLFGDGLQATFKDSDIIISTINAAREYELLPPVGGGLLIADECHRYGSDCNKDALDERFARRLGLSATYRRNDNGNTDFLEPYFGKTCFEMNYKRAINDGVISNFSVALVGVTFSYSERVKYEEYSKKLNQLKKKLTNNFEVVEEPFGEFMKEVSRLVKSNSEDGRFVARGYMKAFKDRRNLLAESPSKMNGLLKLSDAICSANRTLIFTQTIESAETIAETLQTFEINAQAIHSQIKMDERRQILQEFGEGKIKVVVAPQVLDEGIDVPEADLAIIIAASKTRRQMIQRMGRVLRLKKDGRLARFALLFVEETSEDPNNGAHEAFLDEITKVATSVKKFSHHSTADKLCQYLSEMTSNKTDADTFIGRKPLRVNLKKIPRPIQQNYVLSQSK
jgi:superfamily II DNA or RNA helicase